MTVIRNRFRKYIWRPCSHYGEYMEIAVPKLRRTLLADAVIGKCAECGYLLSWLVFVSDNLPPDRVDASRCRYECCWNNRIEGYCRTAV
jgi:hypothetical protein